MMFHCDDLKALGERLLIRAGLEAEKAATVARILVEADLLGHTTHGIVLCPDYVQELAAGEMTKSGDPDILSAQGVAEVWDGRRLPGPWLVERAVVRAAMTARALGIGAVAIRRSHHIACLAAFLEKPAREGLMVLVTSSDPASASVAPYGGKRAVMSPDPLAVGIPASGDPVLIDISASITTNAMSERLAGEGARFPGPWVIGSDGQASDDPSLLFQQPKAALLPTGGMDHGHKGFALGLLVEALTQGLSGYGRADNPSGWGASVLVLVFDPRFFGGLADLQRQTGWLGEACRTAAPINPSKPVRLPGQAALARKQDALSRGIPLRSDTVEALRSMARQFDIPMPNPIG